MSDFTDDMPYGPEDLYDDDTEAVKVKVESMVKETEKAYLFKYFKMNKYAKGGKELKEHWFPKSQVTYDAEKKKLTVPKWLWEKTKNEKPHKKTL